MCGIVGVFYNEPSRLVARRDIQRMCDAIMHRGPDDEGCFLSGSVGLGMRRLSIIDLESGHQPISNEDGTLTIVFNGEIYNHLGLRHLLEQRGHRFATASDTECIVHAYEEFGPACVEHLNGMFVFAIWDARRQELFIARDRLGIKPLYLYQSAGGLAFGSEIKALLTDRSIPREMDLEAFRYFFRYGYVGTPATLLRFIRQLPPAHYLRVSRNGCEMRRYWSIAKPELAMGTEAEHAEACYEGLRRAVKQQLISDVPLGAFLSGGLDSSSIVNLMSNLTGEQVRTYAIGFAGTDSFHNELADARFMSEQCGTRHHEIIVRPDVASLIPKLVHHMDQPLSDSSFIVTYLVSELARESVKVVLSGVGGDELFGGYRRYLGPSLDRLYNVVPLPVRSAIAGAATHLPVDRGSTIKNYLRLGRNFLTSHGQSTFERYDRAVRLVSEDVLRELAPGGCDDASSLMVAREQYFGGESADDPLWSMTTLDRQTSLVDSLLLLTDKMSMATSVEVRVPFLDHELVELAARIPSGFKIKGTSLRHIQKKSMEGRLPDRVMSKKKRGFGCPTGAWFRSDLKALLQDTLSASAIRAHGLLDFDVVSRTIDDHMAFRQDYSELLLAMLTFELWHDEVVKAA